MAKAKAKASAAKSAIVNALVKAKTAGGMKSYSKGK